MKEIKCKREVARRFVGNPDHFRKHPEDEAKYVELNEIVNEFRILEDRIKDLCKGKPVKQYRHILKQKFPTAEKRAHRIRCLLVYLEKKYGNCSKIEYYKDLAWNLYGKILGTKF